MNNQIFQTLEKLGLSSEKTREIYNNKTRDANDINVWKDSLSGVIYIDDFYPGEEIYIDGSYRDDQWDELSIKKSDFDAETHAQRRLKSNLKLVAGKKIGDFGCGSGDFLKLVKPYCPEVVGIELQQSYVDSLNSNGISCFNNLDDIEDNSLDIIVSFYAFEHLPNPLKTLEELKTKIVSGGQILIEVPHAKDFLLSTMDCDQFKQFTLWSQHLILHTRESLRKTLEFVGLKDIQIEGVQHYPLSNHLNWLANGMPGGHKSSLSVLDSDELHSSYRNSLARIDATDTLVALAKVP
jgi:SAM-dependent methyltransferase